MLHRHSIRSILLALCLAPLAWAIQADLAGVVDWHKPLIGEPLLDPAPPRFVDTQAGRRVVALTMSNVLAALDAADGSIAWRYQFELEDPVVNYFVQNDSLLLLSGPGGRVARLFSITSGQLQWERPLLPITRTQLLNPPHLGAHASFVPDGSSVVVVSAGMRVARLSLEDGSEVWGMDAPGAGDNVLFSQVLVAGESVHLLAITHSIATPTLATLTLDLNTSIPKDDFTQIPCIMEAPTDAFLAGSDMAGTAKVVWFDLGRIRIAHVTASGLLGNTKDIMPGNGKYFEKVLPTGTEQSGIILGRVRNSGEVHIINVREGGKKVAVWDNSQNSDDKSPSTYAGAVTSTGAVFSRIYWSYPQSWSVIEAMSVSHNGDIVNSGYTFAFDTNQHGVVLSSAVTPMLPFTEMTEKEQFMPTLMLSTSSGALQLVHSQGIAWTREESLANIAAAKFVDLGEPEVQEARDVLHDESFLARLTRHVNELRSLPDYLAAFTNRLYTGSYPSTAVSPLVAGKLHRDQFGLQKLLVAATTKGKLFALDSANGNVIWRTNLGLTSEQGAELQVREMYNVRAVGEKGDAMLAVLATKTIGENVTTVAFHVNAFTGEPSGDIRASTGVPVGKELFQGEAAAAFLIPFENCETEIKVLAVADSDQHVHLFPKCKKVAANLSSIASSFFFTSESSSLSGNILTGHSLVPAAAGDMSLASIPVWSIHLDSERLISSSPVKMDVVASFGRATGDKGVLYKYQNPHLTIVVTASQESQAQEGIEYGKVQVVDTTTGAVVHGVQVPAIRGEVKAAMVENWLVYAWLERDGWRLGSTELYEEKSGKGVTPGPSTFASNLEITSRTQTFFLPSGMKSLSFSTSRFGVTAKELIYVNARGQVASIPRRILDPRRPIGKPTSADKEEMLLPYDSVIPIDSKRIISHTYPVIGTEHLVSSPALIESTSLLFTHGLDLFLTRAIAPSGTFDILTDSFNKVQLLLTLAGLSVGIAVAKPAVQRKMLNMRWY